MSLKPPKYLYLMAKEMKTRISGFATIELTNNRKYKAKECRSEAELTFPHDKWSHSWKQVLRMTQTHSFTLTHAKTQSIGLFQHVLSNKLECIKYL